MSKTNFAAQQRSLHSPRRGVFTAVAAVVLLGLTACGTSSMSRYGSDGQVTEAVFPKADSVSSWYKSGINVTVSQLQRVRIGDSRDAAQAVLGSPNFAERLGAQEWDYLLNVVNADGTSTTRCQLKLAYNADKLVQSVHWLPSTCAALLVNKVAVAPVPVAMAAPAPALAPAPAPAPVASSPEKLRLEADALFAFNSAELSAKGMDVLDGVAKMMQRDYKQVDSVNITGHADRLGSDTRNQSLSSLRASNVRSYLVGKGLNPGLVKSSGVGSSQPLEACKGISPRSALIACLMPNRRVEVEILGQR